MAGKRRFVFTTFGSFGDLHPYIAIALTLKRRGYDVAIATSEIYRKKVSDLAIEFIPIGPDAPDTKANPTLFAEVMDLRKGPEKVVRELVMPAVEQSYADLHNAVRPNDVLISHPLTFATSLVAEKKNLPWISSVLQPIGFFSVYDPPVLAPEPWLYHLRFLGPGFYGLVFRAMQITIKDWPSPWHALRQKLGLPPTKKKSDSRRSALAKNGAGAVFSLSCGATTRLAGKDHHHRISIF